MTIDELVSFCKLLRGKDRHEAEEIGKRHGVRKYFVETLRYLLGYTKKQADRISEEKKDSIRKDLEAGMSFMDVSRKYGYPQTSICTLVTRHGWDVYRSKSFWTKIKIMKLIDLHKNGKTCKQISEEFGGEVNVTAVHHMVYALTRRISNKWNSIADRMKLEKIEKEER